MKYIYKNTLWHGYAQDNTYQKNKLHCEKLIIMMINNKPLFLVLKYQEVIWHIDE